MAGGTGLAPLLQIARVVLKESDTGAPHVSLRFVNHEEQDILAREEFDDNMVKGKGL